MVSESRAWSTLRVAVTGLLGNAGDRDVNGSVSSPEEMGVVGYIGNHGTAFITGVPFNVVEIRVVLSGQFEDAPTGSKSKYCHFIVLPWTINSSRPSMHTVKVMVIVSTAGPPPPLGVLLPAFPPQAVRMSRSAAIMHSSRRNAFVLRNRGR